LALVLVLVLVLEWRRGKRRRMLRHLTATLPYGPRGPAAAVVAIVV
jgi:hypothetical protein